MNPSSSFRVADSSLIPTSAQPSSLPAYSMRDPDRSPRAGWVRCLYSMSWALALIAGCSARTAFVGDGHYLDTDDPAELDGTALDANAADPNGALPGKPPITAGSGGGAGISAPVDPIVDGKPGGTGGSVLPGQAGAGGRSADDPVATKMDGSTATTPDQVRDAATKAKQYDGGTCGNGQADGCSDCEKLEQQAALLRFEFELCSTGDDCVAVELPGCFAALQCSAAFRAGADMAEFRRRADELIAQKNACGGCQVTSCAGVPFEPRCNTVTQKCEMVRPKD